MRRLLTGSLLVAVMLAAFPAARGDIDAAQQRKLEELRRIEQDFREYSGSLGEVFSTENSTHEERLNRIMQRIEAELLEFDEYRQSTAAAEDNIRETRRKITTLSGQLEVLEQSLASAEQELEVVKVQILKRVADLKYLMEEADRLEAEKAVQQKDILAFFSLLQQENEDFGLNDDTRTMLRLLLSDETFSHNLWEEEQITALEEVGRQIFHDIEAAEREIAKVMRLVNEENRRLNELHRQKEIEERSLEEQLRAKQALLAAVEDDEAEYQRLLEESKQQMRATASQIGQLMDDRDSVQETMRLLEAEYERLQRQRAQEEREQYDIGERFLAEDASSDAFFDWPVEPYKGISAYYLDDEYEDVFHVSHHAIDIPTLQGTEIRAPALGYVYKVTDNGMGYSSLILAHRDNLMTVYGHVSEFLVSEGQLVQRGDVIALSGGMPGTIGAGWMTTGPHLHFEVFKNGSQVNPLQYLSLEALPEGTKIPPKYLP